MVWLVEASLEPPPGLIAFLDDARGEGWLWDSDIPVLERGVQAFLRRHVDLAAGRNLPAGWIPSTTYWLQDQKQQVVAMSNLRHELTPFLVNHGGHIGYFVKSDERGKGYGKQVLALTLVEAREMGIERALLTVDSDNEPSIRVIERNGGIMEDERTDAESGTFRRYWIELGR